MKPGLIGANGAAETGSGSGATVFISEIQVEESAEEFQKFTLKGVWWKGY